MKKFLSLLSIVALASTVSLASFPVKELKQKTQTTTTTEVVEEEVAPVAKKNISKEEKKALKEQKKQIKQAIKSGAAEAENAGDDETIALVLALVSVLLFPFGLHNWYLGRTSQAIWQTVLTLLIITFPISWIWQLVDLFRLLGGGLPS